MNPEELKKVKTDWADRGFPAKVWNDPPGQCWENYIHSVDELFMVLKGEYELQLGEQKTTPQIGEEVFITANLTHCVRNIGGTPASFLYAYRN